MLYIPKGINRVVCSDLLVRMVYMKSFFRKTFIAVFIGILLIVSLTGCTSKVKIDRQIPPMATSGTITYGLYNLDGKIESERHFEIGSEETFEKIFSFGNLINVERDYRLLVFANYMQMKFSVADSKPSTYWDFTAKPNEHLDFTFSIPELPDGFYDLILVIVKDPHNKNLDENYRKQTDLSHMITIRCSLKKGSTKSAITPHLTTTDNIKEDPILSGVFLNQDGNKLTRLLTMECTPADENKLFLHLGNQSDSTHIYAVILLCNWEQIDINSQKAIYCSVPAESRSVLPLKLSITEPGIHNITAICVADPFQITTRKSAKPDFSIRIGVKVTDCESDNK